MTTQMHRIFCVLMAVVMVAVVAAGWFLVAQPQLSAAGQANDEIDSVKAQVASSESSLRELRQQKGNLADLTAKLGSLQASIPSTLASSPLVAGIDAEAASAGVHITDISVDDPAPYAPVPVGSTTTTAGSGKPTASPSPSPTPTASTQVSTGKKSYAPVTDPSVTATNFVPVPVSITVEGSWAQTLVFVKNLQAGSRLYAVSTISSKQNPDDSTVYTTVVSGYVFSILDPSSAAAKAAAEQTKKAGQKAAQSKGTPAPTPSGSPSP